MYKSIFNFGAKFAFKTAVSISHVLPQPHICVLCPLALGWGLLGVCAMRLRAPGRGWGVVVVLVAALLLLAALGLALAIILTRESLTPICHHTETEIPKTDRQIINRSSDFIKFRFPD